MDPSQIYSPDKSSSIRLKEELSTDSTRKKSVFLAEVNGSKSLVFVEPKALPKDEIENILHDISSMALIHSNDRWSSFQTSFLKIDITSPATEKEIARASSKNSQRLVVESPQLYYEKIKPFLVSSPDRQPPSWIKNIINGSSEQDRVLFSDANFIILPDSKWPGIDLSSLYLLVLFKDESLQTIRDLSTSRHLSMLKDLKGILQVLN